jgi:hypothetical protein
MTDDEWLACDSQTRMRGHIRAGSFRAPRWVLFDLACVGRVRDLLGPRYLSYVDGFDGRDESTLRSVDASAVHLDDLQEEGRTPRTLRADPLREAKQAAARAVLSLGSYTLATSEMVCVAAGRRAGRSDLQEAVRAERRAHAALMRCVFCSTLAPVALDPMWRTDTAVALAGQMRLLRDYSAMPILADALQDAGCEDERILAHCRCGEAHARGCWVVDRVLGRG